MNTKPLLLFAAILLSAWPATPATVPASDEAELRAALVSGNTVLLRFDVTKVERFLDNQTFSPPVTIKGDGGQLACADAANTPQQNCYISNVQGVIFDGVPIDGHINGGGWRSIVFRRIPRWTRGRASDGVLLKNNGCDGLTVEDSTFGDHGTNKTDYVDLIQCDNVKILRNTVSLGAARAFVQLKGGTANVEVAFNRITGGLRPLQLGGQTDGQTRPSAFMDGLVHDNYISGGQACAVFSGVNRVRFFRNTCQGQTAFLFRVLIEQGGIDPNQNVQWDGNAFLGYTGSELVNQSTNSPHQWATMRRGPNLYTFPVNGWPAAVVVDAQPTTAASVTVNADGSMVDAQLAASFGVRSSVTTPPPSSGGVFSFITAVDGQEPKGWQSLEEAVAEVQKAPCTTRMFRVLSPTLAIDLTALKLTSSADLEEVPFSFTVTPVEPTAGLYAVPGVAPGDLLAYESAPEAVASCCGSWCAGMPPHKVLRGCACLGVLG